MRPVRCGGAPGGRTSGGPGGQGAAARHDSRRGGRGAGRHARRAEGQAEGLPLLRRRQVGGGQGGVRGGIRPHTPQRRHRDSGGAASRGCHRYSGRAGLARGGGGAGTDPDPLLQAGHLPGHPPKECERVWQVPGRQRPGQDCRPAEHHQPHRGQDHRQAHQVGQLHQPPQRRQDPLRRGGHEEDLSLQPGGQVVSGCVRPPGGHRAGYGLSGADL